jgi:hypothetical protein
MESFLLDASVAALTCLITGKLPRAGMPNPHA